VNERERNESGPRLTTLVTSDILQRMAKLETINIASAKARLPELVERAARGEEIVLARNGRPRAKLVPIREKKRYVFGAGKGRWKGVNRLLARPLPPDVLDAFYS
jgi:prevent-host-death family protein